MKKLLFLMLLVSSYLFAQPTQAQAISMVKANPALLNTPQAKTLMKQNNVSIGDVKKKLSQDKPSEKTTTDNKEINTIEETLDNSDEKYVTSKSSRVNRNPFTFQSNSKVIQTILSKQQISSKKNLTRYSKNFFANKNTINASSLPTPKSYMISTGDQIKIHIYGDRDQEQIVTVKNDGNVELPFLGPIKVGGMKFGDAKEFLEKHFKSHYKRSYFNISMQKYSTIQVTLIGDVKYPGIYNLSSFTTIKDLLAVAKGIRKSASLRDIVVKRDSKVIANIDLYDLLFNGENLENQLLEQGDIVVIKKAKRLVSINGLINHEAIYELTPKQTLLDLMNYAGGLKPNGSKTNIKVERYANNEKKESYKLTYKEAKYFKMKDGDSVYIYPLDFIAKSSVHLYGNVLRPGAYNIKNSKTLYWLFKHNIKTDLKNFFLPRTYFEYGMIKRYNENLTYTTLSFNLNNVLLGVDTVKLKANDEIYIFSKNDIFANSYITTKGSTLSKVGKLQFIEGITIKDAINASGISGIIDDKIKVTTYTTDDFMPKTTFYSLKTQGDVKLNPYDELEVYDYYTIHTLEPVSINGQVVEAKNVYFEQGMSVADLVNMAGGFTKLAYTENIEIVRYYVDVNQTRQRKILKFSGKTQNIASIKLKPYDEVKIFKIPQWGEKSYIILKGEVKFPGKYSITKGEKLSSVIERAGSFTSTAFIEGSVFTRESIKKNQISQYNKTLARLKRTLAVYNSMPANAKDGLSKTSDTLTEVIQESKKYQPIGRVSISLDHNKSTFIDSPSNLVLQNGDTLHIPTLIDTVTVFGEVFNPSSFIYNPDFDAQDYIELASGYSRAADEDSIYVIHADGTSELVNGGWFSADAEIKKGDTIVAPVFIKEQNRLDIWDSVSKIFASFALTAAAINSIGVF